MMNSSQYEAAFTANGSAELKTENKMNTTQQAFQLGANAFRLGNSRVPVSDQTLLDLINDKPFDVRMDALHGWLNGWDSASLNSEVL